MAEKDGWTIEWFAIELPVREIFFPLPTGGLP
jgi:hypothetical protein